MSFQSELRTHLLADATLASLVGTRVYPTVMPDNATLPAITYFRNGGRTDQKPASTPQMALSDPRGSRNFQVQFEVVAANYDDADRVEQAVAVRLATPTATLKCRPLNETQDLYDEVSKRYLTVSSYSCWYTPASS